MQMEKQAERGYRTWADHRNGNLNLPSLAPQQYAINHFAVLANGTSVMKVSENHISTVWF